MSSGKPLFPPNSFLFVTQPPAANNRIIINSLTFNLTQKHMNKIYFTASLCILLAISGHTQTTVVLTAAMDNTIYGDNTANSNGAGQNLFAGTTGSNSGSSLRRALLKFDLSAIPPGASVTSVTLSLFCNKTTSLAEATGIHKLLSNWGQGTSDAAANEGGGTAATPNDATWVSRLHPSTLWATPGGDFVSTASATTSVGVSGAAYTWSSATMVADVQSWINDAAVNFGWIVRGNEAASQTAKRFASRENATAAQRPQLSITYNSTVPVVLSSFEAKETNTGTLITWQTAQEINNDFFLVQHSTDGINFLPLGKVKGNGNKPDASNYQFRHEGVAAGRHFYRLVQTDISGRIQQSGIRSVYLKKQSFSLQISPNPVAEKITLTSSLNQQGSRFSIVNSSGVMVATGSLNPAGINVKGLLPGTYYLRIPQKDGNVVTGLFYKN
jgi:type IX secretion system substrate protein